MTQPASRPVTPVAVEVATSPPYRLTIGPGASGGLPAWVSLHNPGARCALVTDDHVAVLHARPLRDRMIDEGLQVEMIVIPSGEIHKTRATKEKVEDSLIEAGLGRDSLIVAMGGGMVTDLAGFVAATFMRGVPCVLVPTTLLAMVDASIGGKTAVDHPRGKNLIGAFHQPVAVFIDVDALATLPEREFRSGLAEVVKTGVIRSRELFNGIAAAPDRLATREPDLMTGLIAAACRIKAEVVAADEREGDLRKILNFGHTIGHAIEALSGFELAHGEAVSIGMVAEARMAVRLGVLAREEASEIETTLEALGLPVRLPPGPEQMTPWKIVEAARRDKKGRSGRIVYVLPSSVGEMARGPGGYGIPLEDVLAAEVLEELA
ncbi:MAG TPA: 3-dehydroquinate synthase [Candidatus Polarisedimenticolia bacterium]|jgi:3-dehydroquinate synthase